MQKKYIDYIAKEKIYLQKKNSTFNKVGYSKLLLILFLGISLYFTFTKDFLSELILLDTAILFVYIALSMYHDKLHEKINYANKIVDINMRNLDRITGKWSAFKDIGEEFTDREHAYSSDLDIVGKKSLFQLLNITNTWHGRQAFANDLLHPVYTNDERIKRQEAILELSKEFEFSNRIQYYSSKIGADSSTLKLVDELKDKKIFIKSKILKVLFMYIPIVTLLFIISIIAFQVKILYLAGTILIFLQIIFWGVGMTNIQKYLGTITHLPYRLSAYSITIDVLKRKKFTSEKLQQIQKRLDASDLSAAKAMDDLKKISTRVNVRHNGIVYFALNIFFLWDYRCAFMLQDWKEKYAHLSENWFLALGEFESLLSFSNLANICDNTCIPTIAPTDKTLEAIDLGHPLLCNEARINNNISLDNNIFIISGSNMSGKTTFLRTVGINLILARAGSFVCAKQMHFSPMKVFTSMRISDDLNEGVSTFYAELKRIKFIIDFAKSEQNMIFLIDEIFRGTNSIDRLSGAKAVISKLNECSVVGMISTHDLELCELANENTSIKNYSFSEYYEANKIFFDYKIKQGKSNTTNAKFLMEMVGIDV